MGQAIDLMVNYPRTKRDVNLRGLEKTVEDRKIAQKFGQDFFDGNRKHGYGGFNYHPRFWQEVIPTFVKHFQLDKQSKILDIGCAKGFMLYDFSRLVPGIHCTGLDISSYAIDKSMPEMQPFLLVGNAVTLPFPDDSFDLVISITTLHNLAQPQLIQALKEIERVKKGGSYITLDAYESESEKERMEAWNLTAKTVLHVDEWRTLFDRAGYTGDYYWFRP